MKFIIYCKGLRGFEVLKSIINNNLLPVKVIIENEDEKYIKYCKEKDINYLICNKPQNIKHVKQIKTIAPDLIFFIGYSKLISKDILKIPKYRVLNCHGGKLPEYRGASPIPWQIINGEKEGAAYILEMTEGIDDGLIIASEKYTIDPLDTAFDITIKVNNIFKKLVPKIIIKYINGDFPNGQKQDEKNVSYWTRRIPEDGLIRWKEMNAVEIVNLVRGLDKPYPGAFTYFNNKKIIIRKAFIHEKKICGVAGRYVGKKDGLHTIIAKDRAIAIIEYEIENEIDQGLFFKYGDDMEYNPRI